MIKTVDSLMISKVNPPLFTLRGHDTGVTALAQCRLNENCYLISGDEEGSIFIWDVSILRRVVSFATLLGSRIQCLKVVNLNVAGQEHSVLLCQSRDDGVQALDLSEIIKDKVDALPKVLATFPTYQSLFSKGDAVNINKDQALLAYPSCIANHLVTVRLVGPDVQTSLSGSAQRNLIDNEKTVTVFDIIIKQTLQKELYLLVAYEDGQLCLFSFDLNITKTVPILDSTGLKIDLVKKFDLSINEFISAFDVINVENDGILAVCGSPLKNLNFVAQSLSSINEEPVMKDVELKRKGVSAICIHPDKELVAVACWDTTVRIYSMQTQKVLASLEHHTRQVQSIIFVEKLDIHNYSTTRQRTDGNKDERKYLLCCASLEGTISITTVF